MGFGSIPGQGSVQSATQIRDALQSLTGTNRLDASAIKNLPSGGGGSPTTTLLQLNFEGANNSAIFADSSSYARSVTPSGNAKLTTTSPISGISSGTFDGSGSYLTIPSDPLFNFGNGGFSVRGKLKTSQSAAYKTIISRRNPASFTLGSWLIYNNLGSLEIWLAEFSSSIFMLKSAVNVSDGLDHTFDWRRTGNVWTLDVDGTVASTTNSLTITNTSLDIIVARDPNLGIYDYAGLIDDLMIETF